jgi:hypothetical protein
MPCAWPKTIRSMEATRFKQQFLFTTQVMCRRSLNHDHNTIPSQTRLVATELLIEEKSWLHLVGSSRGKRLVVMFEAMRLVEGRSRRLDVFLPCMSPESNRTREDDVRTVLQSFHGVNIAPIHKVIDLRQEHMAFQTFLPPLLVPTYRIWFPQILRNDGH